MMEILSRAVVWERNHESEIICGHVKTSQSDDECAKYLESYNGGEEWLCCSAYHQWYHRFVINLSHLVILLDYIKRLYY